MGPNSSYDMTTKKPSPTAFLVLFALVLVSCGATQSTPPAQQPDSVRVEAVPTPEYEIYNFFLADGGIVWQKVFNGDYTVESLTKALVSSGLFSDIVTIDHETLSCRLQGKAIDFKGAGYNRSNTPMFLLDTAFGGNARVQIRPGRYRVTLRDFHCAPNTASSIMSYGMWGAAGLASQRDAYLDEMFLNKKGSVKGNFCGSGSAQIIDWNLNEIFSLKKPAELNEDW